MRTCAAGGLRVVLASSASGPDVTWDLNGDGDFTDASGAAPTLAWGQLEALGIDNGPATFTVTAQLAQSGTTVTATAQLTVTNAAPTVTITGPSAATIGVPLTVKIGADDPSSVDAAGTFTYTADWGDGSAVQTVTGPADPPISHTYTSAGQYTATFTAADADGGQSSGGTCAITVAASGSSGTGTSGTGPSTQGSSGSTSTVVAAAAPGSYLGTLAYTGTDIYRQLAVGLGLIGAGLLLTLFVRRRRSS